MFATNIAAMNAARKNFGKTWQEFAYVEKVDGQFTVQHRAPMDRSAAWEALISPVEGAFSFPTLASTSDVEMATNAENFKPQAAHHGKNIAAFFASRPQNSADVDSDESEEFDADLEQNLADKMANNAAFEDAVNGTKVKPWIHQSTIDKPVKAVWHVADEMIAQAAAAGEPRPSRKAVQDECVRRGIASGTARTQYQAWKKATDATLANMEAAAAASARFNR